MRIFILIFLQLLLVLTACEEPGSYSAVPESSKDRLREWAGVMARYSVRQPGDSLRPEMPSESQLQEIMELCDPHPEAWSYFYACISDTISKLEPPDPACQEDFESYSEQEIQNR
ncbi:MAG: hypothetical protein R6U39_02955 [Candidatus Aegiribacteria sp.]